MEREKDWVNKEPYTIMIKNEIAKSVEELLIKELLEDLSKINQHQRTTAHSTPMTPAITTPDVQSRNSITQVYRPVPALLPNIAFKSPDKKNSELDFENEEDDSDDFDFDDDLDEEDLGIRIVSNVKGGGTDLLAQSRELFNN